MGRRGGRPGLLHGRTERGPPGVRSERARPLTGAAHPRPGLRGGAQRGPDGGRGGHGVGTDVASPMLEAARGRVADGAFAAGSPSSARRWTACPCGTRASTSSSRTASGTSRDPRPSSAGAIGEATRVARPGAGLFVFTFSRATLPPEDEPMPGETFVFTQFAGEPQCFLTEEELVARAPPRGVREGPAGAAHRVQPPGARSHPHPRRPRDLRGDVSRRPPALKKETTMTTDPSEKPLSPWWRHAVILVMIVGFTVLTMVTVLTYTNAPPIPERVTDAAGTTLFTRDDIERGPGGLPQVRPDGARHAVGPRGLPGSGLQRRVPAPAGRGRRGTRSPASGTAGPTRSSTRTRPPASTRAVHRLAQGEPLRSGLRHPPVLAGRGGGLPDAEAEWSEYFSGTTPRPGLPAQLHPRPGRARGPHRLLRLGGLGHRREPPRQGLLVHQQLAVRADASATGRPPRPTSGAR